MSKIGKHIIYLYQKEDWQGIVDSYHEKNPLGKESVEVCKLFVNALRRKGFFVEANSLEQGISKLKEKPRLPHVAKLAFSKEFNRNYSGGAVAEYLIDSLGKEYKEAWVEFIQLLAKDSSLKEFDDFKKKYNLLMEDPVQYRKIFIAGFGRSGTGALRDFLNEFKEVYEVPGSEVTVISGRRSLSSLSKSKNISVFKERFLEFFLLHALGVSDVNDHADNKELQKSKIIISKVEEMKFLNSFFCFYVEVVFSEPFSCDSIEKSSQKFINRYIASLPKPRDKKVYLFNNVVNAHKLWMMRLVDNYLCFPVSRDPRSQYASYISTWRPDFSVTGFIKQFKRGEELYDEGIASLSEKKANVVRVFFEDIVCSENERLRIAKAASLDIESASRFTLFKPEESMANVLLHESGNFECCKQDFELIVEHLFKYCSSSNLSS